MNQEIKIESGIEITPNGRKGSGKWVTLLKKMKHGDSVLLTETAQVTCLRMATSKAGRIAVTRKNEHGTRVWVLDKGGAK